MKASTILLVGAACLMAAGCHNDMWRQPKMKAQTTTDFFDDQMDSSRIPPANTVAYGEPKTDVEFYTGYDQNGEAVHGFPVEVDEEFLARGKERFGIFCSPCHGQLGDGKGMISQRGFQPDKIVPSYFSKQARDWPEGAYFDIITNGYGMMYPYAARIKPMDRWAIIAYIRVLQKANAVHIDDLTSDDIHNLEGAADRELDSSTRFSYSVGIGKFPEETDEAGVEEDAAGEDATETAEEEAH
jgi:mono/diheme cytochrome c family protein